ncbi:MAG: hypothetical protein ACLTSX_08650 [Collinsella sp.]
MLADLPAEDFEDQGEIAATVGLDEARHRDHPRQDRDARAIRPGKSRSPAGRPAV